MLFKSVLAVLTCSSTVFAAAHPPHGYPPPPVTSSSTLSSTSTDPGSSSSTPSTTKHHHTCPKSCLTSATTITSNVTTTVSPTCRTSKCPKPVTVSPTCQTTKCPKPVTVSPTCHTSKCPKHTITDTVTSTKTLLTNHTKTVTPYDYITETETPGPVVDLIAYEDTLCGVHPVEHNGNAPQFQELQLKLPTYYGYASIPFYGSSDCLQTGHNPLSFSWDVVSFDNVGNDCDLQFYTGDSCDDDNGGFRQLDLTNGEGECHNLKGVRSVQLVCGL